MAIKFAGQIIEEIEKRGLVTIPDNNVTGEAFEEWLMYDWQVDSEMEPILENYISTGTDVNEFTDNYGEAA